MKEKTQLTKMSSIIFSSFQSVFLISLVIKQEFFFHYAVSFTINITEVERKTQCATKINVMGKTRGKPPVPVSFHMLHKRESVVQSLAFRNIADAQYYDGAT